MKILHAADGSPHADTAEQLLNQIPFPKDSEIIVANVLEEIYVSAFGDHLGRHVREAMHDERLVSANELLKTTAGRFSDHFETVREELLAGHAAHELTELAASEGVDLMTLGARGMNALERFLLGSTSEKVLRHAPCSVLVAHSPSVDTNETSRVSDRLRLVVAYDGSPAADEAVETLNRLPLGDSAEIVLLYVHSLVTSFRADVLQRMSQAWRREEAAARAALDKAAGYLEASGAKTISVRVHEADDAASQILKVADAWNADIIMSGDTGKSGGDRFLMGSVCRRLTRHASCGVWVVRKKHTTGT